MLVAELKDLLAAYWPLILVVAFTAHLLSNKFYKGLNKYPGHPLAAYTNWWRFYDVLGRRSEFTHQDLHKKHGDIVRLGPNVLSFADPKAIKTIYGLNKGMTKVGEPCLYQSHFANADNHDSLTSTPFNKQLHKASACNLSSALPGRITMPNTAAASTAPSPCPRLSPTNRLSTAPQTSTLSARKSCSRRRASAASSLSGCSSTLSMSSAS